MASQELRIIYWNPDGIKSRKNDLLVLAREYNPEVVLLGETKLRPQDAFRIPNYFMYRRDELTPAGRPFRGTAALVRRDVVHDQLDLLSFTSTRSVGVRVHTSGGDMRIYAAYRPPGPEFHPEDIRRALNHDSRPALLVGDLNAKHVAWGSRLNSAVGWRLLEDADRGDYSVVGPDEPTHIPTAAQLQPDVLDVCVHKGLRCPLTIEALYDLGTPHLPILVTLGMGLTRVATSPLRPKVDWELFKRRLVDLPVIQDPNTPDGVDDAAVRLVDSIRGAIDQAMTLVPSGGPRGRRGA